VSNIIWRLDMVGDEAAVVITCLELEAKKWRALAEVLPADDPDRAAMLRRADILERAAAAPRMKYVEPVRPIGPAEVTVW
jgi:hypothetical protein